jgi:hypothetical protein
LGKDAFRRIQGGRVRRSRIRGSTKLPFKMKWGIGKIRAVETIPAASL